MAGEYRVGGSYTSYEPVAALLLNHIAILILSLNYYSNLLSIALHTTIFIVYS